MSDALCTCPYSSCSQVRLRSVQHTRPNTSRARGVARRVPPRRLDAVHSTVVLHERVEEADGVAAADRRRRPGSQAGGPRLLEDLPRAFRSPITDWNSRTSHGLRVRAGRSADQVVRVAHVRHLAADRLVHRVPEDA